MKLALITALALALQVVDGVYFSVTNNCAQSVWINQEPNFGVKPLPDARVIKMNKGQSHTYNIPSSGWAGRLWPKTGCDANGYNCQFGDATPPCPSTGCTPPADTKAEFYFGTGTADSYYDISLVDGYTLPMKIAPVNNIGGSCTITTCAMSFNSCPLNENVAGWNLGDHRIFVNGQVVACLSPCKRWNYPYPYGMGLSEQQYPGNYLCCPTPPISVEMCRTGPVEQTSYVRTVRANCPSAYSYAYDDEGGLHMCPYSTSFAITICP